MTQVLANSGLLTEVGWKLCQWVWLPCSWTRKRDRDVCHHRSIMMKQSRSRSSSIQWNSKMSKDAEAYRERVQVVVRCRPLLSTEIADGRKSCVIVDTVNSSIQVRNPKMQADMAPKTFTFDRAYDSSSTQRQIYQDVGHPIVHSVMSGYNGTVLVYGQTASGKTFTMDGPDDPPGIYMPVPLSFNISAVIGLFVRFLTSPIKLFFWSCPRKRPVTLPTIGCRVVGFSDSENHIFALYEYEQPSFTPEISGILIAFLLSKGMTLDNIMLESVTCYCQVITYKLMQQYGNWRVWRLLMAVHFSSSVVLILLQRIWDDAGNFGGWLMEATHRMDSRVIVLPIFLKRIGTC